MVIVFGLHMAAFQEGCVNALLFGIDKGILVIVKSLFQEECGFIQFGVGPEDHLIGRQTFPVGERSEDIDQIIGLQIRRLQRKMSIDVI